MITESIRNTNVLNVVLTKAGPYYELLKVRLSLLVAFSSAFGFILVQSGMINWLPLFMFSLGGFLISGSALTINQILEKDFDQLMKRTRQRPLPTGRLSIQEALSFAIAIGIAGIVLLAIFTNVLTVMLSLLSFVLYSFVYTPLKRVGPVAVFVGAIPGALPPLIGAVAAEGIISIEGLILFGIQFIWQFPHFWAIAWLADDDYKKAGFKLLPARGKKDLFTATNIMIYTLFLIPISLLPMQFDMTGMSSAFIAMASGIFFLLMAIGLMRDLSRKSALKIMYGSFLYLPVIQIAYLFDKI